MRAWLLGGCLCVEPDRRGWPLEPGEAGGFLRDYDVARGTPLTSRERLAAAGAVAWILAFNARWQVGLQSLGMADDAVVDLVRERHEDYLTLAS